MDMSLIIIHLIFKVLIEVENVFNKHIYVYQK